MVWPTASSAETDRYFARVGTLMAVSRPFQATVATGLSD